MKAKALLVGIAVVAVLVSCSLGGVLGSPPSASSQPASGSAGTPSLTVTTDSSRNQGVLVTSSGSKIDVSGVADDGTTVNCVDALAVASTSIDPATQKGLGGAQQAIIVGTRNDGKPGVWSYSSNKIQTVIDEDSGKATSALPELADVNGEFRGSFGWTYHVVAISPDGKLIAGYAENKRGFTIGKSTIDPGTTIGVYWRVSRHPFRPAFLVSRAHIIGTFDFSSISNKRTHRLASFFVNHALAQLQLFLLNYLSSYLVMVDKNGVSYDSKTNDYLVSGTDQNGQPAVAAIDAKGDITISPIQQQATVDLAPSAVAYTGSAVQKGGSLPVTATIQNLQSGSVSVAFSVDFYITLSTTFSPSTDTKLGSATVSGIGANATTTASATLTIPSSGYTGNNAYIYAVVDAAGVTGDINTSNNISTPATAAVVWVNSNGTYYVVVATYAGSGTGSNTTEVTLYKDNGSGSVTFVGDNKPLSGYGLLDYSATGLTSGTYYALVSSVSGSTGPYAFEVATGSTTTVADMTSDSTSNDNTLTLGTLSLYAGAAPTNGLPVKVNGAVSWFLAAGDRDWFTFTLP